MKNVIFTLSLFFLSAISVLAQPPTEEQKIIQLSKDKWQWMAEFYRFAGKSLRLHHFYRHAPPLRFGS